jgi:hypothetical protein
MGTRRTPKTRRAISRVTPAAVELYRLCREIEDVGLDEKWERDGGRRRESLNARLELRRMLGIRPWQVSVLEVDQGEPPPYERRRPHRIESWARAQALQRELEQACQDPPSKAVQ